MEKRKMEEKGKKKKEKTKWGEIVTPVLLTCKDTLCVMTCGDTSCHLIGSPIGYIG